MPLSPGTKLGPYEISTLLGAGGMGEVYRARDERLGREVAIKVLPSGFADDEDRMRRFEHEARTAGMLNHPNILAIYDVGEHEGQHYVVSELLEGETLREVLTRGPLPARRCVEYARQVVSGLIAAHDKGIVHRDLKPENLFVTRDGWVKILDFGLAKLTHTDFGGEDQTNMMTAAGTTIPGVIMGTVGYMSPEQVRGEAADHRSDIFSFGAIFYEMLTGRRAFKGHSPVETMSAILKDDPPPLSEDNLSIAPAIDRIVCHCLEKNPDHRFQSARDLGFHLEAVTGLNIPTDALPPLVPARVKRQLWPYLVAFTLFVLLAVAFMAGQLLPIHSIRAIGAMAGLRSVGMPNFHQLTFRRGTVFNARFGPDSTAAFYGAAWDGRPFELFTTKTDSPEAQSVLPEAELLAVSSKGEMAILLRRTQSEFLVWEGTLARVAIAGGGAREVLENVQHADWTPDGNQLAVVRRINGKSRIEYPIGKTVHETDDLITRLRFSPDGKTLAFLHRGSGVNRGWTLTLLGEDGGRNDLFSNWGTAWGFAWYPGGGEIWVAGAERSPSAGLWAFRRSGRRRLVLRAPGIIGLHDIASDGRVLLSRMTLRVAISSVAPGEPRERDLSWFGASYATDLSADGRTLLFWESEHEPSMYIRRTDGSPAVKLGPGVPLSLSPDGNFALGMPPSPVPQLVILPTGPGEARNVINQRIAEYRGGTMLPGGKRIVFTGREQGAGFRLYVQEIESGEPQPITDEGVGGGSATDGGEGLTVSPDGQWVAAMTDSGLLRLYPVNRGTPRDVPGIEPGECPIRWADAQSLYVHRLSEMPARVYRVNTATGRRELVREVTPIDPAGILQVSRILLASRADAFAYSYSRLLSEVYVAEGLN